MLYAYPVPDIVFIVGAVVVWAMGFHTGLSFR